MAISTVLKGGLGNMMFIAGAIEHLGKRFGYETAYLNIKDHLKFLTTGFYSFNNPVDELTGIFKNFNWNVDGNNDVAIKQIIRLPFKFEHIRELQDDTEIICYFQSEEYWGGDREFMQKLFEPSDFVLRQIEQYRHLFKGVPCAIHVRRGDYLKYPNVYDPVDVDYIERAKHVLRGYKITHYLVFSDDMKWCRDNLKGDKYVFVDLEKDYLGMFLIGECPYKIIANSAYSWWGAYLSRMGGVVVAPRNWVKDPKIDDSHVCPWYWKKI